MSSVFEYLAVAFSPMNLLMMVLGTLIGIIFGALPGFTPSMGVAVFIPVTYKMEPVLGLIFLVALYSGAMYGGSITAILINTPGTAASACSAIDGHKMTEKGQAFKALVESSIASTWGGLIGCLALLLLAPVLAKFAIKFGPQENFLLGLFGLTIIASLATESLAKGIIAGCVGLLICAVGMDPITGAPRFVFNSYLLGGIPLVPIVIGLFAVSQVISTFVDNKPQKNAKEELSALKREKIGIKDFFRYPIAYIRSSIIGVIIGIIPGTGGEIASYVAYNQAKMSSKHPEEYGQGSREALANAEAAKNGAVGGTLVPTLTLGIPGNATAAVLLGGLTIHGLAPGYELFTKYDKIVYPMIAALFLSQIAMLLFGLFGAKTFAKVTLIPKHILGACVLGLSVIGTYALKRNINDLYVMFIAGIVGYVFKRMKIDTSPICLGMILGSISERGLYQSLILCKGDTGALLLSLITRPICLVLILLMLASLIIPFYQKHAKTKKTKEEQTA